MFIWLWQTPEVPWTKLGAGLDASALRQSKRSCSRKSFRKARISQQVVKQVALPLAWLSYLL
jgi:hypothetical protein